MSIIDNLKNELVLKDKEIYKLKDELNQKNYKIEILEKKITELELMNQKNNNNNIDTNSNELQKLYSEIEEKEKNIEKLINQLLGSIKHFDLKFGDEIIVINFISSDSKINFPIVFKNSLINYEDVKNVSKKNLDFGENGDGNDIIYLGNGLKIKKFKTKSENSFDGYGITIIKKNLY